MPHWMTSAGKAMNRVDALAALMEYRVIFFGERHDSRTDHAGELAALSGLADRDPNLALALEMFERDVQDNVDAYLRGEIPEGVFLDRARPWPNYREDYRPLVEFAKERGIPVIAANAPRRMAAAAARDGQIFASSPGMEQAFRPRTVHSDSDAYYSRFATAVSKMPAAAPMKGMSVEGLYRAQVLKDAVMAAALEPFLDRRIFFCCGHFHSDFRLGVPCQLQKNHPALKIAVVTGFEVWRDLPEGDRPRIADFIWVGE